MINVIALISVKPGKRDEFLTIFKANLPAVHAEEGCIEYFPAVDIELGVPAQELDANKVTIIEKWETLDHLKAHGVAPHMLSYRERVKDIVEDVTLKVVVAA